MVSVVLMASSVFVTDPLPALQNFEVLEEGQVQPGAAGRGRGGAQGYKKAKEALVRAC